MAGLRKGGGSGEVDNSPTGEEISESQEFILNKMEILKTKTARNLKRKEKKAARKENRERRKAKRSVLKKKIRKTRDKIHNNKIMTFLRKLLVRFLGVLALRQVLINILTKELPTVEKYIKLGLKQEFKNVVNCSLNAPIPDFLQYTGTGTNIKLSQIDFLSLFHVDPTSEAGLLIYYDATTGENSKGFDTFLYNTTLNPGIEYGWGHQTSRSGEDILMFTFYPTILGETDVINIKASEFYSDNKTLTALNNDYLDSLSLFPDETTLTSSIDGAFKPMSYNLHIPKIWLFKQAEIDIWLEKMSQVEEVIDIDDSFFEFSNDERVEMENLVNDQYNGVRRLENCTQFTTTMNMDVMNTIHDNILSATTSGSTYMDLTDTITNSLDVIAKDSSKDIPPKDKFKFEVEFFSALLDGLTHSMGNAFISPQLAVLFQLSNKVVYGETSPPYPTARVMLLENKVIYTASIKLLSTILAVFLVALIIKHIKKLINKNKEFQQAEALKAKAAQIISLVGLGLGQAQEMYELMRALASEFVE